MEYAIIKDGEVVERIVCDKKFADKRAEELGGTHTTAVSAQVGFKKSGSKWIDMRPAPVSKKTTSLDLDEMEKNKLIDFYVSNGIISAEKSARMKG